MKLYGNFGIAVITFVVLALVVADARRGSTSAKPVSPVSIVIASDLHYIAPELTDHGAYFQEIIRNGDGKITQYIEELTEAFVTQIIADAPDSVIISGDLTFNGAKQSHERLAEKLNRIIQTGISVYVLPGNHDLLSGMAAAFHGDSYEFVESLSPEGFAEIYQNMGYGNALSRDPHSLSYTVQLSHTIRALFVDVNTPDAPGNLTPETLRWIEKQLRKARASKMQVLAVSHQNLRSHNTIFTDGFTLGGHEDLERLYRKYQVIANLSGHMHIEHSLTENGVPELVTSSLAVSPNQYGILTLDGKKASYHTKSVNVSDWAKTQGIQNPDILNFAEVSAEFFRDTSRCQAGFAIEKSIPDKEADILADYFADLNAAYYAGCMNQAEIRPDILERWQEADEFFALYLKSMLDDRENNMQSLEFTYPL